MWEDSHGKQLFLYRISHPSNTSQNGRWVLVNNFLKFILFCVLEIIHQKWSACLIIKRIKLNLFTLCSYPYIYQQMEAMFNFILRKLFYKHSTPRVDIFFLILSAEEPLYIIMESEKYSNMLVVIRCV